MSMMKVISDGVIRFLCAREIFFRTFVRVSVCVCKCFFFSLVSSAVGANFFFYISVSFFFVVVVLLLRLCVYSLLCAYVNWNFQNS